MSDLRIYLYIAVMVLVTFAIRVLPLTLIRKKIRSRVFRSFLYYVPYVTLAVMTFPAIMDATRSPWAGLCSLILGVVLGIIGADLFTISVSCCAIVFILELFLCR